MATDEEAIAQARATLGELKRLGRARRLSAHGKHVRRRLEQWLLEQEHGEGAVATRRADGSGRVRVVYRPGTQAEADEGWTIICWSHGFVVATDTRRQAESAASDPDWCERCQMMASARGG